MMCIRLQSPSLSPSLSISLALFRGVPTTSWLLWLRPPDFTYHHSLTPRPHIPLGPPRAGLSLGAPLVYLLLVALAELVQPQRLRHEPVQLALQGLDGGDGLNCIRVFPQAIDPISSSPKYCFCLDQQRRRHLRKTVDSMRAPLPPHRSAGTLRG